MKKEEFVEIIQKYLKKIDIKLNEDQIEKFYVYMNILLEWNEKMNLTAIIDPNEIILKHFIDSIIISKYVNENANVVDVGTGAGFPGIPLKIVRNDINIVLVDSLNKRINFLQEVIKELKFSKIEAIHSRVEEFAKKREYREKFDYATSRAVANLSTLSEYLVPLIKVGGKCICMKGPNVDEEIKDGKNAILILGGKLEKIDKLKLPDSDICRTIITVGKVKNTPLKYPRKPGLPAKEPLN